MTNPFYDDYGITGWGLALALGLVFGTIVVIIALFTGDSNVRVCGYTSRGDVIFCVDDGSKKQ